MSTARIEIPKKLTPILSPPRGSARFRAAHGGRGSGKSLNFAKMAAVWGYAEPLRILCTREFQNSIKDSMHAEIKNAIKSEPWLSAQYEVGENFIRGKNGTEFIFKGLRHNIDSIKSMAQIDLCIVEEAATVPKASWQALLPTIRAPKSEIWIIYNPCNETDPVDEMMRKNTPPRTLIAEVNYHDNPFFPAELDELRRHDRETMDPDTYAHVWEGAYLKNSDAQILHGKFRVKEFEALPREWDGPYYGLDYGFANDPTAVIRAWVHDNELWVDYEAGRAKLDIDDTPELLLEKIPGIAKHVIRADSARPESTSYLKRHGLPYTESVTKWPGSVEDGISHLRSYRWINIHPRCKEFLKECRLYSYKRDRLSGDILPVIIDAHNHWIDSLRYALNPLIQNKTGKFPKQTRPGKTIGNVSRVAEQW